MEEALTEDDKAGNGRDHSRSIVNEDAIKTN